MSQIRYGGWVIKPKFDLWYYGRILKTDQFGTEKIYSEKKFWLEWMAERWVKKEIKKIEERKND